MKRKKTKKYSVARLKRLADSIFSKYIRLRDNCICITCDKKIPFKKCQNGHYISRVHNSLRYSEINCNAQCMRDNFFHEGVKDVYALRLIEKYGIGILYELQRIKGVEKEFTAEELLSIIQSTNDKIRNINRARRTQRSLPRKLFDRLSSKKSTLQNPEKPLTNPVEGV